MNLPSASELLGIWERGLSQSPLRRSLLLLTAVSDDLTPEQLVRLSIGQCDTRLLTLRERLLGQSVTCLCCCPACAEQVESQFDISDIRVNANKDGLETLNTTADGYEVVYRLPNCLDLLELDRNNDPATNSRGLMEKCLMQVSRMGQKVLPRELEGEIVKAINAAMSHADPQADIQLAMRCSQCAHEWATPFDIGPFLWSEIHAWATRLLREVHSLASKYGWRESDILALSPGRRQAYLDMINP